MPVSNYINDNYIIYSKDIKLKLQERELIVDRRFQQDLKK